MNGFATSSESLPPNLIREIAAKALKMNISVMRAFVEVRRVLLKQSDIKEQLRLIQERLMEHDVQLSQIYDSIENLLDDKASGRKWDERQRIGYRK